jgi:hypothetical protein
MERTRNVDVHDTNADHSMADHSIADHSPTSLIRTYVGVLHESML